MSRTNFRDTWTKRWCKHKRDTVFGIDHESVENLLEDNNITARKSPTGLRWERREKDEEELPQSEQRVYEQLLGKLLWIDRVDWCCVERKASSSLGRESETYMENVKSNLEALARQPWSDDSRNNASTESCVRGKHCWSSQQAGRQSIMALNGGETEMVASLSGACVGMGPRQLWVCETQWI